MRVLRKIQSACFAVLLASAVASSAQAAPITSDSDPALADGIVLDFEDQALGTYASISIDDVTFVANSDHLRIDNSYQMYNQQGIYLDNGTYGSNGFLSMTIFFDQPVSAFGFTWGMAESWQSWDLLAYDSSGDLIEVHTLPSTGASNAGEFYGIAASEIDHAVLTATQPGYDWIAVDNFTYVIEDSDDDGVPDSDDLCPDTASGATVDIDGCSIDQYCPCEEEWKNHGSFVSCVAHTAEDFVDAGLITDEEKDAIVSAAGQSDCGR